MANLSMTQAFVLILKRGGLILLALMLSFNILEQIFSHLLENELNSRTGATNWLWVYSGGSVLISLLQPSLVSIFTLGCLRPIPLVQQLQVLWPAIIKESMRALGQCMTWGLLLILPGLIRFVQLTLLPFVIVLDPNYSLGQIDALQESTRLVRKRFWSIFLLVILTSIVLPVLASKWDELSLFALHPYSATALTVFDTLTTILVTLLFYKQWEKCHEPHVQP